MKTITKEKAIENVQSAIDSVINLYDDYPFSNRSKVVHALNLLRDIESDIELEII